MFFVQKNKKKIHNLILNIKIFKILSTCFHISLFLTSIHHANPFFLSDSTFPHPKFSIQTINLSFFVPCYFQYKVKLPF